MKWFIKCFKQYIDFSGRARRKEYWMFVLFNLIFASVATALDNITGLTFSFNGVESSSGWISLIYSLVLFLPGLGVCVRRLHDIGKSGWFIFIALIPIVGAIWLIVLYCKEGDHGNNEYGPDPKAAEGQIPLQ